MEIVNKTLAYGDLFFNQKVIGLNPGMLKWYCLSASVGIFKLRMPSYLS